MSAQSYQAEITEIKTVGSDAAITAVVPHPSGNNNLIMSFTGLIPRDMGLQLKITDKIHIVISTDSPLPPPLVKGAY